MPCIQPWNVHLVVRVWWVSNMAFKRWCHFHRQHSTANLIVNCFECVNTFSRDRFVGIAHTVVEEVAVAFFRNVRWTIRTILFELNCVYDFRMVRTKRRRRLPFSLRGRSGWFHPISWKTKNYEKYLRDSQCNDTVNRFNFILIYVLMTVELIPTQLQRTPSSFAAQMVRRLNERANRMIVSWRL